MGRGVCEEIGGCEDKGEGDVETRTGIRINGIQQIIKVSNFT